MSSSGLDASARCLEANVELMKARGTRLGVVLARGQVAGPSRRTLIGGHREKISGESDCQVPTWQKVLGGTREASKHCRARAIANLR